MILYFSLIELAELLDVERPRILSHSEAGVWRVRRRMATLVSLTPFCTGTPIPDTCRNPGSLSGYHSARCT